MTFQLKITLWLWIINVNGNQMVQITEATSNTCYIQNTEYIIQQEKNKSIDLRRRK